MRLALGGEGGVDSLGDGLFLPVAQLLEGVAELGPEIVPGTPSGRLYIEGSNKLTESATPGWRISVRTYSHQYHQSKRGSRRPQYRKATSGYDQL